MVDILALCVWERGHEYFPCSSGSVGILCRNSVREKEDGNDGAAFKIFVDFW